MNNSWVHLLMFGFGATGFIYGLLAITVALVALKRRDEVMMPTRFQVGRSCCFLSFGLGLLLFVFGVIK